MIYYGIKFNVFGNACGSYDFNSCWIFKTRNEAKEHAQRFIEKCSDPHETVKYNIEKYSVAGSEII